MADTYHVIVTKRPGEGREGLREHTYQYLVRNLRPDDDRLVADEFKLLNPLDGAKQGWLGPGAFPFKRIRSVSATDIPMERRTPTQIIDEAVDCIVRSNGKNRVQHSSEYVDAITDALDTLANNIKAWGKDE